MSPHHILIDLSARSKSAALAGMVSGLAQALPDVDTGRLLTALEAREAIVTTGIGRGVAVPHTDLDSISEPILAVGVFPEGLEFDSLDGEPTHVVFMLLGTPHAPGRHLNLLARIAKLSKTEGFVDEMRAAQTPQGILQAISRRDTP